MARPGRPPADTMTIVYYLLEHGPMPGKLLAEAAARGHLPLGAGNIRTHLGQLVTDGWLSQRMPRGDYYPARHPDTGEELHTATLSPEEWAAVQAMRTAA